MKLIKFSVEKMHGYIDVDIRFKNDLSIIVGGNGSGKTSALSLLANVLRMQKEEIIKTKFEKISLIYESLFRKRMVTFSLNVSNAEGKTSAKLLRGNEVVAEQQLADITDTLYETFMLTANLNELKRRLLPQFSDDQASGISDNIFLDAKVTFVRLDRAISAIDSHGGISFEEPESKKDIVARVQRKGQLRDPLDVVRDVTMSRYVSYRNSLEIIKSKTYDELFRIHFADSDLQKDAPVRLDRKLADLEVRLARSTAVTNQSEFQSYLSKTKIINTEFQSMKAERKTGRKTRLEEVLGAQLASRAKKIEMLLDVFDEESRKSIAAYQNISTYLDTLNGFLRDSQKQLSFSLVDNQLYYSRLGHGVEGDALSKDLSKLSSGEKQIIIVLTYLAFLAEPGSIFIVDEPELSLHLKWQRKLIEALRILCPVDCQIILATHAPEIAGRARDKCIRLNHEAMH